MKFILNNVFKPLLGRANQTILLGDNRNLPLNPSIKKIEGLIPGYSMMEGVRERGGAGSAAV